MICSVRLTDLIIQSWVFNTRFTSTNTRWEWVQVRKPNQKVSRKSPAPAHRYLKPSKNNSLTIRPRPVQRFTSLPDRVKPRLYAYEFYSAKSMRGDSSFISHLIYNNKEKEFTQRRSKMKPRNGLNWKIIAVELMTPLLCPVTTLVDYELGNVISAKSSEFLLKDLNYNKYSTQTNLEMRTSRVGSCIPEGRTSNGL